MQQSIDALTFWKWIAGAVFSTATILATIYKVFLSRKQPQADYAKTLAEAHKIVLDDAIRALTEAKETIVGLRKTIKDSTEVERDRDEWKAKYGAERELRMILEGQVDMFRHGGNGKAK